MLYFSGCLLSGVTRKKSTNVGCITQLYFYYLQRYHKQKSEPSVHPLYVFWKVNFLHNNCQKQPFLQLTPNS